MYEAPTRGLINAILLSVYLFTKWWKDMIHLISFPACPDYCVCSSLSDNLAVECRRANLTSIPSGTLRDFVAVYVVSLVFVFLLPLLEIHVQSHVENNRCAITAAHENNDNEFIREWPISSRVSRERSRAHPSRWQPQKPTTCIILKHIRLLIQFCFLKGSIRELYREYNRIGR